MPFLVAGRERYALPIGETTLGGTDAEAMQIPELAGCAALAVLTVTPEYTAEIRPVVAAAPIAVDGTAVSASGRRLVHGARIELGGVKIFYGDIRATGSTSGVAAVTSGELTIATQDGPLEPTADHGGSLVAVDGGTVYRVPPDGLLIGRDPSCDVVLADKNVSRRHATIAPALVGYLLTDSSENGTTVNGVRVAGTRVLGRGDVVAIGKRQFRFDADAASYEPTADLRAALPAPPSHRTTPDSVAATQRAPRYVPGTPPPTPSAPRAALLATFEVLNEGPDKGVRIRVERPLVQIGRSASNDVVLRDASVSAHHALLRLAGARWTLSDTGSTNGTYVDDVRLASDHVISGPVEIRFGNVKLLFRPIGARGGETKATRGIVGVSDNDLGRKR
ncbi:MAG: hypothetical protein NVS1B4_19040 [Gemmatimonadaceae bacterium]